MSAAPLNPVSVSHIVLSLVSENQELAKQTRQRIEELVNSYPPDTKDRRYLNNIITLIDGSVARVIELRDSLKQKVDDFDSINEEAALVMGTFLAAVSQIGNITNMAIWSGVIAGSIKMAFKITKWRYRVSRKNELTLRVDGTLKKAIKDAEKIYNDVYTPTPEFTITNETMNQVSWAAASFSTTVI